MKLLPEERLLQLLRGPAKRPALTSAARPSRPPIAARLASWQRRLSWSRIAMAGGAGLLVVELMALAVTLARPQPDVRFAAPPPEPAALIGEPPAQPAPVPALADRVPPSLFAPPAGRAGVSAATDEPGGALSAAAITLASRLTLMGIVSGAPPQAIIEDAQTNKTYFVTEGQRIVGGAVLREVLDNRVLLELNGERIELML